MLVIFSKHGKVKEVVIPGRRNATGQRFSFVPFLDVREMERMATILDNIYVEGEKIHVNLPQFGREKVVPPRPRGTLVAQQKVPQKVWKEKIFSSANPKGGEDAKDRDVWNYEIPDLGHLSVAMVGEVINPGKAYNVQDDFARQGVFTIKATPMGLNLVLLEGGKDGEDFSGFIDEAREWVPVETNQ